MVNSKPNLVEIIHMGRGCQVVQIGHMAYLVAQGARPKISEIYELFFRPLGVVAKSYCV